MQVTVHHIGRSSPHRMLAPPRPPTSVNAFHREMSRWGGESETAGNACSTSTKKGDTRIKSPQSHSFPFERIKIYSTTIPSDVIRISNSPYSGWLIPRLNDPRLTLTIPFQTASLLAISLLYPSPPCFQVSSSVMSGRNCRVALAGEERVMWMFNGQYRLILARNTGLALSRPWSTLIWNGSGQGVGRCSAQKDEVVSVLPV